MSAKRYNEVEAWSIFFGGLIIGIVISSMLWAYVTRPRTLVQNDSMRHTQHSTELLSFERPHDFIRLCRQLDGTPKWDSTGFKECRVHDSSQESLASMNQLCKKYSLNLTYGSEGIVCQ